MLASVENRLQITLNGLTADEVASLAAALRTESLDEKAIQGLYRRTGGHPLYLRTVLSEEIRFRSGGSGPAGAAPVAGRRHRGPFGRFAGGHPDHPRDAFGPQPPHPPRPAGPGGG